MVGAVTVELLEVLLLLVLEPLPPQPPMLMATRNIATAAVVRGKDCHPAHRVRLPLADANNRSGEGAGSL